VGQRGRGGQEGQKEIRGEEGSGPLLELVVSTVRTSSPYCED